jgi:ATP-dependent DNA ligase
MLQHSYRTAGFIKPCLPSPAKAPPAGADWLHEIKHDGFRILALRDAAGVRLITRNGYDLSKRFPMIAAAVAALPMLTLAAVTYCTAVGETVVSLKELPGDNSGFSGAKAATLPSAVRLFWTLS